MSLPLKEPNCYVENVFAMLWHEKIRFCLENASKSNPDACGDVDVLTYAIESILRTFPYRERLNLRDDVKNNAKAVEIRNQGNKMFHPRVKRYIEAIKLYNESITYAEKGSEERAKAYANRSIICLKLHRYNDCLENVRLARESNYPKQLLGKLQQLEKDATRALKKATKNQKANQGAAGQQAERQLKLSYPAHENMPQVANCLQLQRNEQYGRHVVTNRRLNVGDVVMIEKPFVTVLDDLMRYVRCAYCHHEEMFSLIPCEGCTVAMYCSEECLSKAHRQYHRYECAVIRDLWRISGDIEISALRAIALAIAAFDHDLVALREHLDSLDELGVNAFTMDWRAATPKDVFDTVHVLTTNQQLRDHRNLALNVFVATVVQQLVMERTELGSICEVDVKMKKLLFDLILRYFQIYQCNSQCLYFVEFIPVDKTHDFSRYATGCCPLISMLNHSCAPNLCRITLRDGSCAVVVTRPIAEGGQLFVNYGVHHLKDGLELRQAAMKKVYRFRCRCEACQNNYPTLMELVRNDGTLTDILFGAMINEHLLTHNTKKAIEHLPVLKARIENNAQNYPDYEGCQYQVHLECCFYILYCYTSNLANDLKYCNP